VQDVFLEDSVLKEAGTLPGYAGSAITPSGSVLRPRIRPNR